MSIWKWFATASHDATTRNKTAAPSPSCSTTSETTVESGSEKVQTDFTCVGAYELYNILRQRNTVDWCQWHLNITENNSALKTAAKFHQDFEKLKLSSSIIGKIDIIQETFLNLMPMNEQWNNIRNCFKQARQEDSPLPIIRSYTMTQEFSGRLNRDLAANTYHALKLYCTLLNCPILLRTQDYTEAITSIFFHPKLEQFLVREKTIYRGFVLDDGKFVANYKEGATIITTTFLSTSTIPSVADSFSTACSGDSISVFCTYNIGNTRRHTALCLREISNFVDEEEILILPYVPFTIKSLERTDHGRRMKICFDECKDDCTLEENIFRINAGKKAWHR